MAAPGTRGADPPIGRDVQATSMNVGVHIAFIVMSVALGSCSSAPMRTSGEAADVRVTVSAGIWNGKPSTLARSLTPLHITVENGSGRELIVRYDEITVNGPALMHEPLPPRELTGRQVIEKSQDPIFVPRFEHSGFHGAPGYLPNFSELRPWDYPWDYDRNYYVRQYPKWPVALPTLDMIEAALPEGVLEPRGRVSGFVYYEKLDPSMTDWTLAFDLIEPWSGLAFGTVRVPLSMP